MIKIISFGPAPNVEPKLRHYRRQNQLRGIRGENSNGEIEAHNKSINFPLNQVIWMVNTNPPSQISKSRRIKGFGENIGQLSLGVYISHLNVPLLYMISQKVLSPLSMSHLFMED
jgi:hypothetical protein